MPGVGACKLSYAMAESMANVIRTTVGINSVATLNIYAGTVPTLCSDATTAANVILAAMSLSATGFAVASSVSTGAVINANTIGTCTSAAAGTATFFRVCPAAGTVGVVQGVCATDGTADMIMNTTSIASSATVQVTSYTITVPQNG